PGTASIFAWIGLPVNLRGLALRDVGGTLLQDGQRHVLAVAGEIANLRSYPQAVPAVRVGLRAADGREIYAWTAAVSQSKLGAGETIAFRTRLLAPPREAREVVVRFADAADAGLMPPKDKR